LAIMDAFILFKRRVKRALFVAMPSSLLCRVCKDVGVSGRGIECIECVECVDCSSAFCELWKKFKVLCCFCSVLDSVFRRFISDS
jgi:hypothetical protein